MKMVKNGDIVQVSYVGKLKGGSVFAYAPENRPFKFRVGELEYLKGFQEACIGMRQNEQKEFSVSSEKAFGSYIEKRVIKVERNLFKEKDLEEGSQVKIKIKENKMMVAKILKVSPKMVTLDTNHPLAGKDLDFFIKLLDVQEC